MDIKSLIFDLCIVGGVSGSEEPVNKLAQTYLKEFADVSVDCNGNLFAVLGNKNADKTILLDAHSDRIGLMVTDINEDGFVKVDKCGGIDLRTLCNTKVVLQSNPDIKGVVCCMPPHLSDGNEDKAVPMDKVWVDFGMPCDEVKKYISFGDVLIFDTTPKMLLNNKITASALDNRCSIAAFIKVAQLLNDCDNLKYKVVILLSAQEETFGTGAKTGAFSVDADEAIVVDVSFASQPDVSGYYGSVKLGGGPMICISPILNKSMSNKLVDIAKQNNIAYQLEPISSATGTNADSISVCKGGVKTAVVSIPQKNMHTPAEIISIDDVENTAKLIAQYIISGGAFNA